jgi:hypothetical protein
MENEATLSVKLADLNPEYKEGVAGRGYLGFDCPVCGPKHRCPTLPVFDIDNPPSRESSALMWAMDGVPPEWAGITLDKEVFFRNGCNFRGFLTKGTFTNF